MAKLTVTVLLFTLSLSVVSSKPENEIINPHTTDPTLPGSGSGSGSGSGPELTSPDEVTIPVNFMNFHPINRHFPRLPLTTASFNHRPCHHRRHEMLGRGLQIPYGNDMILSGEEKASGTKRLSEGVIATIVVDPFATEKTEHHLGREIENTGEVQTEEDGFLKITVKLIKREEGEDEKKYMFRRKIRKFLNHFI